MAITRPIRTREEAWDIAARGVNTVTAYPDGYGYARNEEAFIETRFAGFVVEDRERNYHDDSDFYAVVWNPVSGTLETVEYATTRFPTLGYGYGAAVDATPEVLAAVAEHRDRAYAWRCAEADYARRNTPRHGAVVTTRRVIRPRGKAAIPAGTTGDVFWTGPGFKRYDPPRVGVRALDGSRFFTAATNVIVHWVDTAPEAAPLAA